MGQRRSFQGLVDAPLGGTPGERTRYEFFHPRGGYITKVVTYRLYHQNFQHSCSKTPIELSMGRPSKILPLERERPMRRPVRRV